MGRRVLCTGIIVGAVVGGLVALTNKEARDYAKVKLTLMRAETRYCMNNPTESVRNLRQSFEQFSQRFSSGAGSAVNALEQMEHTLDKIVKRGKTPQKLLK